MWMWLLVKISIYHTFIASLLKKLVFWNEKFQINHMVSKHGSYYVKNILKIFQKLEVGYTQTCTSLKNSIIWHPKGGHCSVLSPRWVHLKLVHYKSYIQWFICMSTIYLLHQHMSYKVQGFSLKCQAHYSNSFNIMTSRI
jgi:hypothetical protein